MDKSNKLIFTSENNLSIDEKQRTIEHYISTETVNRHGYVLKNSGMQKDNYTKNPIVLYQHSTGGFFESPKPSEVIIGKNLELRNDGKGIVALTQFDNSELAEDIFQMNVSGYMNAWSVGWESLTDETFVPVNGVDTVFVWDLLEYSAVIIPANPDAVNKMLSMTKSDVLKKQLTIDYVIQESKHELELKISELEKQVSNINNELTKKDLADFKNEIKSLINNHKKQSNENLMKLSLKMLNLESNLHNYILSRMQNIIETSIKKILGKLD